MRTKGSKNRTPIQILKARLDKLEIENKKLKAEVKTVEFLLKGFKRFLDLTSRETLLNRREVGKIIKHLKGRDLYPVTEQDVKRNVLTYGLNKWLISK